jgi:hypothetical protein
MSIAAAAVTSVAPHIAWMPWQTTYLFRRHRQLARSARASIGV